MRKGRCQFRQRWWPTELHSASCFCSQGVAAQAPLLQALQALQLLQSWPYSTFDGESTYILLDGTKATATAATIADPVGPTVDFRPCHMI